MSTSITEPRPDFAGGRTFKRLLQAIDRPFAAWETRRRFRAQLRDMPEYLLRDIGLDIEDARAEADKPFWRT